GVSADRLDASGTQEPSGISEGIKLMCPGDTIAMSDACNLTTYSLFASFTHLLSRNALAGVSYDLAYQDGFLSNPYRTVIVSPSPVAERHPFERTRHAVAVLARLWVPRVEAAIVAAYRYYWDSWDIHSHTPELRVIQQVGRSADTSVRYRNFTTDDALLLTSRNYHVSAS